ncbi:unnamed protein product [Cladocopium goreaui]|uniref:Uncharacterized protein n=1 Tax=Cladocopium goreaui TaxID=2562237 RepID=A0A9P1BVG2_9DINO|nr:unnamed protein product [Cladocopium goreaui]
MAEAPDAEPLPFPEKLAMAWQSINPTVCCTTDGRRAVWSAQRGYDFPLAHQECAGWAQGLRHAASVPSIASPGPLDQSAMVGMTGKSLVHPNRQHARARSSQAAKKKPGNDPPELPPESRASFSWVSPKIPLALENQV